MIISFPRSLTKGYFRPLEFPNSKLLKQLMRARTVVTPSEVENSNENSVLTISLTLGLFISKILIHGDIALQFKRSTLPLILSVGLVY